MAQHPHIFGCILGTAVGDAIGLPREGLSRRRGERLFGNAPLKHRLIFGRGLCSDDTEHTVMVAQALAASGGEIDAFAQDMARRLRWWFLRLPAGVGLGTLRACLKLWIGIKPHRSGVHSAGNGPAMRSALLGLAARNDQHLAQLVTASTRVTHTDPRALEGAHLIAAAAHHAARDHTTADILNTIRPLAQDAGLRHNLDPIAIHLEQHATPTAFADHLGLHKGVSGFVNHTVPVALYCWLAHRGSFRDAVESAVCLGGDTDTVAAIVGGLSGSELGPDAIPPEWVESLAEWPATVPWLRRLADKLHQSLTTQQPTAAPTLNPIALLARNLVFIPLVLAHGFRRLAPPY